jgi:hypothetical protein
MIKRFLLIAAAALALSAVAFGTYTTFGHRGHAEAARLINCTAAEDTSTPPNATITCTGKILIITPFGRKAIDFVLVVNAIDNPPKGPSFGDVITGCTLSVNGGAANPIHVGPCP